MKKTISIVTFLLLISVIVNGQKVDDILGLYTQKNGATFTQPLADLFTGSLSSGNFTNFDTENEFKVTLSLVFSSNFVSSNMQEAEYQSIENSTVIAPTVLGANKSVEILSDDGLYETFAGGFDVSFMPFAIPQVTLSTPFHTEVSLRFMSLNFDDDFDKNSLFGLGIRHDLSHYFTNLPLDLKASFSYHHLKLGNYLVGNTQMFGVEFGKTNNKILYHGRLAFQNGSFDLEYSNLSNEISEDSNFSISNDAKLIFGGRVGFNLGFFQPVLELNYSNHLMAALNLGFKI